MKMTTQNEYIERIYRLDRKLFSALDLSFAAFVCRMAGEDNNYPLFLAAAIAANASVQHKHTCICLNELSGDLNSYFDNITDSGMQDPEVYADLRALPIPENWTAELADKPKAIAIPKDDGQIELTPLVLDGSLLYIYRDWLCEQTLAREIRERCMAEPVLNITENAEKICGISKYFQPMNFAVGIDWQQLAVFAALRRNFTVISGGPGTGKTTVAAAICTLLLEHDRNIKITLCAPTGKAQARMRESILAQLDGLNCREETKELLRQLPIATIHRLLGGRPGTPRFRWNEKNKLKLDVLIVDEASMISQSLIKALFAALPKNVKVIMLGDMLQLASVESGMVLGDFCKAAGSNHFDAEFVRDFELAFPESGELFQATASEDDMLAGSVIELKKNHRFRSDHGLGLSVSALRSAGDNLSAGDAENIVNMMNEDGSGEVAIQDLPQWVKHGFEQKIVNYLKNTCVEFDGQNTPCLKFLSESSVERAYELFNKFRIVCVHRSGYYGAEMINSMLEKSLSQYIGINSRGGYNKFYQGRPIIINENNYAMELFNGDTGIIWPDENDSGELKAFFPDTDAGENGGFRSFNLNLLPAFSPAYAITVHKAQGSGFQQVLIITPSKASPLMTREMIYTAISRAEQRAVFWTDRKLLTQALQSVTRRHSNLSAALKNKKLRYG
jgi:exodeoxyribonuclease V alpha subunit